MAERLRYSATRAPIGFEDIEVGTGHVEQTRAGVTNTYHKVPLVRNLGLLSEALESGVLDTISDEEIAFTGFYKNGDGGEGVYYKLSERFDTNDIGVLLTTKLHTYRRQGALDGNVNIKWFGAVGDGIANDLAPFLASIKYSGVNLVAGETYLLHSNTVVDVNVYTSIEVLGFGAKIIMQTPLDTTMLKFHLKEFINYFSIQNVTIEGYGLYTAFEVVNPERANFLNVSHTTKYVPEFIKPDLGDFLYRDTMQTVTGEWTFEEAPTLPDVIPSDARHPVPKKLVDALASIDTTPYVTYTDTKTITSKKNYQEELISFGTGQNSAITLGMLTDYVNAHADELLAVAQRDVIDLIPPIGYTMYIVLYRYDTTPTKAKQRLEILYPGTTWEQVVYSFNGQAPSNSFTVLCGKRPANYKAVDLLAYYGINTIWLYANVGNLAGSQILSKVQGTIATTNATELGNPDYNAQSRDIPSEGVMVFRRVA